MPLSYDSTCILNVAAEQAPPKEQAQDCSKTRKARCGAVTTRDKHQLHCQNCNQHPRLHQKNEHTSKRTATRAEQRGGDAARETGRVRFAQGVPECHGCCNSCAALLPAPRCASPSSRIFRVQRRCRARDILNTSGGNDGEGHKRDWKTCNWLRSHARGRTLEAVACFRRQQLARGRARRGEQRQISAQGVRRCCAGTSYHAPLCRRRSPEARARARCFAAAASAGSLHNLCWSVGACGPTLTTPTQPAEGTALLLLARRRRQRAAMQQLGGVGLVGSTELCRTSCPTGQDRRVVWLPGGPVLILRRREAGGQDERAWEGTVSYNSSRKRTPSTWRHSVRPYR